jgi:hypothetical protein
VLEPLDEALALDPESLLPPPLDDDEEEDEEDEDESDELLDASLFVEVLLGSDFVSEPADFLFEPPAYKSEYQPLPLRMKLALVICRFAACAWHASHSLIGSSDMRCTRSNS